MQKGASEIPDKKMEQKTHFGGIELKNFLVASSSPLTETAAKVQRCKEAGFGGVILKTAAHYSRSGNGYGRKVVFIGEDYYADSSFEREILTLEEGLKLYQDTLPCKGDMLVIPSVSADSMKLADWIHVCSAFDALGAKLIQLDFFYLGSVISGMDSNFYPHIGKLMTELQKELNCTLLPKLNFHFAPELIFQTLAESGIGQVSLLDSIRHALPKRFGLHPETTSYFGRKQLPLTLDYVRCAVKYGLEVCAGGGVDSAEDVDLLLESGATLVQTASYILKNGFSQTPLLLHKEPVSIKDDKKTWCDAAYYGGDNCEKCGFCLHHQTC